MNTGGMNEMTRASGILAEAARMIPAGPWHCEPLGARRYPQRVISAGMLLVAECYEEPAAGIRIGPYLALMVPDVIETLVLWLGRKGAEWSETVEWRDGRLIHAGGCTGVVGHETRDDGCGCFDDALRTARAVLDAAAGEWSR